MIKCHYQDNVSRNKSNVNTRCNKGLLLFLSCLTLFTLLFSSRFSFISFSCHLIPVPLQPFPPQFDPPEPAIYPNPMFPSVPLPPSSVFLIYFHTHTLSTPSPTQSFLFYSFSLPLFVIYQSLHLLLFHPISCFMSHNLLHLLLFCLFRSVFLLLCPFPFNLSYTALCSCYCVYAIDFIDYAIDFNQSY